MEQIELTILMPVLNEENTLEICIEKAKRFLYENNINGEILIADNESIDKSVDIAKKQDVRIVKIQQRGYGNALINGGKVALGKYTIMGDADDSYNFLEIMPLLEELRKGYDLVIGNRYKGKMEKGSMKILHKYIGTPLISYIARRKYKVKIGDFNCGLRGYNTDKMNTLNLKCKGMEYATEMIIEAQNADFKIKEIPINFYKDKRQRRSHLNTIRDGIRHINLILGK